MTLPPNRLPQGLAPLFLTLEQAAAYAGVSPDTFLAEVAAGLWPAPVRRGAKGTKQTWHRESLEAAARAITGGTPPPGPAPDPAPQPSGASDLSDADRDIVERLSAKSSNRAQHGHAKAA